MKIYDYKSYEEYLEAQMVHDKTRYLTTSEPRRNARAKDIQTIKLLFPEAKSVLCIGCRHPLEMLDFTNQGFEATGIDLLSPVEDFEIDVKYIQMDMHTILEKFGEKSFDVIYSSHSLEHSPKPEVMLTSIASVAKMGAIIVLPKRNNPDIKYPLLFDFMMTHKTHTASDVQTQFDKFSGNLQVDSVEYRFAGAEEISIALKIK